jgi:hypothetical protein
MKGTVPPSAISASTVRTTRGNRPRSRATCSGTSTGSAATGAAVAGDGGFPERGRRRRLDRGWGLGILHAPDPSPPPTIDATAGLTARRPALTSAHVRRRPGSRPRPPHPGPAQGRTPRPHRGHARARDGVRAGRQARRGAALRVGRGAARGLRLPRPAVVPRPVLRRLRRAARRARLLHDGGGVLRARARRRRRARRAVLRSAVPHQPRRADGHHLRGPARGDGRRRAPLRHQQRADHVLPAPPARGRRRGDAGRGAAAHPPAGRRRARQRRARQSTGQVRPRVRARARARPAPGGPRRRGGPGGQRARRARPAPRRSRRPRRALRRRSGAGGPAGARAGAAHRVPAVEHQAARLPGHARSQPRDPAARRRGGHDQQRRPGVLRRLHQRQLPRGRDRARPVARRADPAGGQRGAGVVSTGAGQGGPAPARPRRAPRARCVPWPEPGATRRWRRARPAAGPAGAAAT